MSLASPFSEFERITAHVLGASRTADAGCLGDHADGPGTAPRLMFGL